MKWSVFSSFFLHHHHRHHRHRHLCCKMISISISSTSNGLVKQNHEPHLISDKESSSTFLHIHTRTNLLINRIEIAFNRLGPADAFFLSILFFSRSHSLSFCFICRFAWAPDPLLSISVCVSKTMWLSNSFFLLLLLAFNLMLILFLLRSSVPSIGRTMIFRT